MTNKEQWNFVSIITSHSFLSQCDKNLFSVHHCPSQIHLAAKKYVSKYWNNHCSLFFPHWMEILTVFHMESQCWSRWWWTNNDQTRRTSNRQTEWWLTAWMRTWFVYIAQPTKAWPRYKRSWRGEQRKGASSSAGGDNPRKSWKECARQSSKMSVLPT